MANKEIIKAALFRSHFEAAKKMPPEARLAFYDAMFDYQFLGETGEMPHAIEWIMAAILPVLDKELGRKQGGRPECDIPAEELEAKRAELGSVKAVAEFYGISERTVFNKLSSLQKLQKTNEERRTKNVEEENEEKVNEEMQAEKQEERVGQSPPAATPPSPPVFESLSENSVRFPVEAAKRL